MSTEDLPGSTPSRTDGQQPSQSGRWSGWFASDLPSTAAAIAVAVLAVVLWWWRSNAQVPAGGFWSAWGILALDLGLAVLVGVVVASILTVVGRLLRRKPSWWLWWAVTSAGFLMAAMGGGASPLGWLLMAGLLLVAAGVLAGSVVAAIRDARAVGEHGGTVVRVSAGAAVLVIVVIAGFVIWPGGSASVVALPAAADGVTPLPAAAADPTVADPGTAGAGVTETRYGAARPGPDAEYGPGVPIVTEPVDASGIIGGWNADSTRSSVWGFDASSLPLNGIVWMPQGPGPFPLVVLVHGNSAFDHSERGLRYLSRSIAAQGYLVASIDENFLSTGVFDKSNPITGANPARAWLVLQHVRQFVEWNKAGASPFTGKIDVSRISLIGHSRGGEAVAVAAAFNTMPALPDHPQVTFDFGFDLRSVVAIAPSDGQYLPGDTPVVLREINYLTIAGTMDADVGTFAGALQFARVEPDAQHLVAAVAIHRADHTQFNSDWGRFDVGFGAAAHLLATGPLLNPAQQQSAAAGLIGAFLNLTVQDRKEYRGLFDGSAALPSWLPDTVYLRRFVTGDASGLTRFENGDSMDHPWGSGRVTCGDGTVVGLPTKTGPSTDHVLQLAATSDESSYDIKDLAAGRIDQDATITVDAGTDASADIGIAVRATDASGRSVSATLRPWASVPGVLDGRTLKPLVPGGSGNEVILATFSIPVSVLAEQGLDVATTSSLSIVVTGASGRHVYLDDVGVR